MDDKDREAVEWLAASIREGSPMDPRNVEHMKMAERVLALARRALLMKVVPDVALHIDPIDGHATPTLGRDVHTRGAYYRPLYAEAPDE